MEGEGESGEGRKGVERDGKKKGGMVREGGKRKEKRWYENGEGRLDLDICSGAPEVLVTPLNPTEPNPTDGSTRPTDNSELPLMRPSPVLRKPKVPTR